MTSLASGMTFQANGEDSANRNMSADSMCIIDDAYFDLPFCSTTETSWYSSSYEDMERFYRCNIYHSQSTNAADNIMPVPLNRFTLYRQSAFGSYLRPAHSLCVNTSRQDQMKRCFNFLSKINEKRREEQRLSQAANIQEAHGTSTLQNNATFHRMISERNRRIKLKQHFWSLHSLLPKNSKKDKYSILSNTTNYLSELKHQVDELEQRNCALEELLKGKISNKEGCSSFDQKHEEHLTTLIYSSDEVVLEQSKNIPNELHIRLNVQIDPLSSPTSLVIFLLERLRGLQLEVVSVESNIETFNFHAHLLIKQNEGDEWERSKWENLAEVVRLMFI